MGQFPGKFFKAEVFKNIGLTTITTVIFYIDKYRYFYITPTNEG